MYRPWDPADYHKILQEIGGNDGATSFDQRLRLARKVFEVTSRYDQDIAKYFGEQVDTKADEIKRSYQFSGE